MGRKLVDLTGQRFGRLVVEEYLGREHHSSRWRCRCDCGAYVDAQASGLRGGTVQSCGCFRRERMAGLNYLHGGKGTPEFKVWDGIKQRCRNPKARGWANYGGRGIRIADEWAENFKAFLGHVGRRPSPAHSIERIDSNGHYEPGNVRWATVIEQARNRSNNRQVEWQGRMVPLIEAAELAGLPYKTVRSRIAKGWPVERALSTPVNEAKVDAARRGLKGSRGATGGQKGRN